ncbi:hypothetical protein WA026_014725 [Henosepilachna vigintioctopunctata]|uniref:RRM domain-containing protein n=1 Tax=Henosepilachna vigintioctopunctata TaxID=420089 RepID=A0AAW1V8J7_9CUCU
MTPDCMQDLIGRLKLVDWKQIWNIPENEVYINIITILRKMSSAEIEPKKVEKQPKSGIIYISSIPLYMTQIREYFGKFGTVGRVFLQIDKKVDKEGKLYQNTINKLEK